MLEKKQVDLLAEAKIVDRESEQLIVFTLLFDANHVCFCLARYFAVFLQDSWTAAAWSSFRVLFDVF